MNLDLLLTPDLVTIWVTGLAMLALAISLFFLDVSNQAQRMFALLIALRGLTFIVGPLRSASQSIEQAVLWATLAPYLVIPLVPVVIAFLCLYPRRRGLARLPGGLPVLGLATLGLLTWYLVDHSAYAAVRPIARAPYGDPGPLYLFNALRLPVFAFAGFILAGDYKKNPRGSAGFSQFLIVAAFVLNGLYDGITSGLGLVKALEAGSVGTSISAWTSAWVPPIAGVIALATCLRLIPVLRQARNTPDLQEVTRFFVIAIPLAALSPFADRLPLAEAGDISTFFLGFWRLTIPLLVAYALMRYQLFELDLGIKASVRRGIILGSFTVVFFFVSEAAEGLLQGDRGPLFGVGAAGLLALAARPVQRFADGAAQRFMPEVKPIAQQTYAERLAFYLEQYRLLAQDGTVTPKERRLLNRLRRTLSLEESEAQSIEDTGRLPSVQATSLPEAPAAQASRFQRVLNGVVIAGALALVFGMLSEGIESIVPLSNAVAGFITAALVAFSLGPLEALAQRIGERIDPAARAAAADAREKRRAFYAAMRTALEDGSLSERDLDYLGGLQHRLGISASVRWAIERKARRLSA